MKYIIAVAIAFSVIAVDGATTSANSLQLSCDLPSAVDGTVIQALKITIGTDGGATVWHRSDMRERETSPKVLFHYMGQTLKNPFGKTSVLVVESRDEKRKDLIFDPHIYIINWGNGKLAEIVVPADREPLAVAYLRWECTRTD